MGCCGFSVGVPWCLVGVGLIFCLFPCHQGGALVFPPPAFSHPGLDFTARPLGCCLALRTPTSGPGGNPSPAGFGFSFWFCHLFGNRSEKKAWGSMGKGQGAIVRAEGWMGQDTKPTNLLCLRLVLNCDMKQSSRAGGGR